MSGKRPRAQPRLMWRDTIKLDKTKVYFKGSILKECKDSKDGRK